MNKKEQQEQELRNELAMRKYASSKLDPTQKCSSGTKRTVRTLPVPSVARKHIEALPVRLPKPRPVGSHLGGQFDVVHRYQQGGNSVKVERPPITANTSPDSPLRQRPSFEFDNVALPAESYFAREFKPISGLLECKRLIKAFANGTDKETLQTEYDDYLRSINLCPNCKHAVSMQSSIAYPVTDVADDTASLNKRRKEQRINRKINRRALYYSKVEKTFIDRRTKGRLHKFVDRITEEYADIPVHFELYLSEGKLKYRLVGVSGNVQVTKREVSIEHRCKGDKPTCKRNTCKCTRKTSKHYLESLTDVETGETLIYLPHTYRVTDERCSCAKRYAKCGQDIPNNMTMAKHIEKCMHCPK